MASQIQHFPTAKESFWTFMLAFLVTAIGFVGFGLFLWVNSALASMPPRQVSRPIIACEDNLDRLYLSGSFMMPGRAKTLRVLVGHPAADFGSSLGSEKVVGLVVNDESGCEARCRVTRFERFAVDQQPAFMELDCEGSHLATLHMPLDIQWVRSNESGKPILSAVVRMGSAIYGVEESPLQVALNRYEVTTIAKK